MLHAALPAAPHAAACSSPRPPFAVATPWYNGLLAGLPLRPRPPSCRPQATAFMQVNRWWELTSGGFRTERQELAARALAEPANLALQAAVLDGIDLVQRRYVVAAVAALVLGNSTLLTTVQLAELWVSCWPYMSSAWGCRRAGTGLAQPGSLGQRFWEQRRPGRLAGRDNGS